ncbi:MAG TPA: P1 family peptidase [Firmicutes bacterium]|nr:P1 family peptidase [Candidatus Fermentithermobacillaceae bacterium]
MGCMGDVPGLKVGHAQDLSGITGVTVILAEDGAVGGVSVLGGAPGTRETDLLRPSYTVDVVHAIFLAGGSAFGLDCARGIVQYLEERGVGLSVPPARIPLVAGAIIFDLDIGDSRARPTPEMAYAAASGARATDCARGSVGAGTGATVGKLFGRDFAMKGGLGVASGEIEGFKVAALVVVNAAGDIYHPESGQILAGAYDRKERRFLAGGFRAGAAGGGEKELFGFGFGLGTHFGGNTTIGVVGVDAALTKEEVSRLALMAQAGLARAIRPVFTPYDGDTMFALATGKSSRRMPDQRGERSRLLAAIGGLGQELASRAVVDAVVHADGLGRVPSAKEILAGG